MNLDELERLCREATPGPWAELEGHPYLFANARGPEPWHHDIVGRFDYHSEKDRAFIAALRNAAPELIAMARAGLKLRALVANDAYAITFQHSGHYRTALLKAFDAAMQEQKP